MAPARRLARTWVAAAILVAVLVTLGVGYFLSVLLIGLDVQDTSLIVRRQQPPAENAKESFTHTSESQPLSPAATTTTVGGKALVSHSSVWNFTHRQSRGDAVPKVGGVPIEPIHGYLKKKSGGKWIGIHPNDLRITPLLPQVNSTLPKSSRFVFMDLGARMYPGSTGWFLKKYPRSREFHAIVFELLDLEHTYTAAKPYFRDFTYERKAAWTHNDGVYIKGMRMGRVDDNVILQKGDNRPTWRSPSVDVATYIMTNFTKDDFVVVKLDIEGGEWTLLPHLVRSGAMEYIDELFLECHPMDFADYEREPNRLPAVCIDFINDLRALGVYCHRWF